MQTSSFRPELAITNLPPAPSGILQRKCARGNHTFEGGECAECLKGNNNVQRNANDHSALGASHSLSYGSIIHPKLTIGASNDPLELEADHVADQVLAAPTHSAVSGAPPRIQRYSGQATGEMDMEQRFGDDFSRVRVHSGPAAGKSATDLKARADSVGNDTVVGTARLAPANTLERPVERLRGSPGKPLGTGDVRIHTDTAAESAQSKRARSYTLGQNIVFICGEINRIRLSFQSINPDGEGIRHTVLLAE